MGQVDPRRYRSGPRRRRQGQTRESDPVNSEGIFHFRSYPVRVGTLRIRSSPVSVATLSPSSVLDSSADCRVLVVEDDEVCRDIVLLMLERLGYCADIADDGVDAISAIHASFYDVVLMDVRMPRMGGIEAARMIRTESDSTYQPVIIAMTADTTPQCQEECLRAGMDGHLGKPVRFGDLDTALEHRFRRREHLTVCQLGDWDGRPDSAESVAVVFDPDVLDFLLVELGGDEAMRTELIDSFILDSRERLTAIVTARDGADLEALAFQAHALKSASATVGLPALSEVAADIEAAAMATPDEVDVVWQASRLVAECERANEVLTAVVNGTRDH